MTLPNIEKVRDLCSQGRWNAAVDILLERDAAVVADFMLPLPFEQQRALFRAMPVDFAASLIGHFPYFHAYVLLHSRPVQEMHLIMEAMNPSERDLFLDALPEEAWQSLMSELAETHVAEAPTAVAAAEPAEEGVAIRRRDIFMLQVSLEFCLKACLWAECLGSFSLRNLLSLRSTGLERRGGSFTA
jgi:Mg/Co/Ni transporter MgtE